MISVVNQFLSRLNYNLKLKKLYMNFPYNKSILDIINVLYKEGYLFGYQFFKINDKLYFKIKLKYYHNTPVLNTIKHISTSSHQIYWSHNQLKFKVNLNRSKIYLLSTNQGIVSHNTALKNKLGGLILGYYY